MFYSIPEQKNLRPGKRNAGSMSTVTVSQSGTGDADDHFFGAADQNDIGLTRPDSFQPDFCVIYTAQTPPDLNTVLFHRTALSIWASQIGEPIGFPHSIMFLCLAVFCLPFICLQYFCRFHRIFSCRSTTHVRIQHRCPSHPPAGFSDPGTSGADQ